MIFEQISVGGDRNFSYLLGDEGSRQAAVVDLIERWLCLC